MYSRRPTVCKQQKSGPIFCTSKSSQVKISCTASCTSQNFPSIQTVSENSLRVISLSLDLFRLFFSWGFLFVLSFDCPRLPLRAKSTLMKHFPYFVQWINGTKIVHEIDALQVMIVQSFSLHDAMENCVFSFKLWCFSHFLCKLPHFSRVELLNFVVALLVR